MLRLPVAHLELNAIELIWENVSRGVARKNKTFKMKDVKMLKEKALANVTVEEEYWRIDFFGTKCPLPLH